MKDNLTVRKEPPQDRILIRGLAARQRSSAVCVPASFTHHSAPHVAHLHAAVLSDLPHGFGVLCSRVRGAAETIEARDVGAVGSAQHTLVNRRRRDQDDAEVGSASDVLVREDGVHVGGERVEWDILLWASWGVREARVVGALVGEVLVHSLLVDLMASDPTQEDGEKADVLLRRIGDSLREDLVLSVAGCIDGQSRPKSPGFGPVVWTQAIEPAYLECLRGVVTTQATAITFVSSSLSSRNMHAQREVIIT